MSFCPCCIVKAVNGLPDQNKKCCPLWIPEGTGGFRTWFEFLFSRCFGPGQGVLWNDRWNLTFRYWKRFRRLPFECPLRCLGYNFHPPRRLVRRNKDAPSTGQWQHVDDVFEAQRNDNRRTNGSITDDC